MQKSGFIKVIGCVESLRSTSVTPELQNSWIRIEHIFDICPLEGQYRIKEEITQDEYDNRPNDEYYGIVQTGQTVFRNFKYFDSCRIHPADINSTFTLILNVRESAESLIARINAVEFPPETPDPVTLGYAQERSCISSPMTRFRRSGSR